MARKIHEFDRLLKLDPNFEWLFADDPKAENIELYKHCRPVNKESGWYLKADFCKHWVSREFPYSPIDDCFYCGRRTNLFTKHLSSDTTHHSLKDRRQLESWGFSVRLCMGCMNKYRAIYQKCRKADDLLSTVRKIERIYKDARTQNNA